MTNNLLLNGSKSGSVSSSFIPYLFDPNEPLLGYQRAWINDQSPLKVWEKSRRIGASWAEACASVLAAIEDGNSRRSTIYLGYNSEMTEGFIRDCEFWARAFNAAVSVEDLGLEYDSSPPKTGEVIDDAGVLTYQLKFAKFGTTIKALSSKPRNLRSKQARVVIDEAAFVDDLGGLLKAGVALLIWGGSLAIISTHDGLDNPFAELLNEINAGQRSGWVAHRTTIDDALAQGLYRRVCQLNDRQWSPAIETEWLDNLLAEYTGDADEELRCVPYKAAAGKVFSSDLIRRLSRAEIPAQGLTVRFWDLASTEADLRGNKAGGGAKRSGQPCYTAGVLMRLTRGAGGVLGRLQYSILNCTAVQKSAGDIDALILATAIADGSGVMVRWELEGGSAGKRDAAHLATLLVGFDAQAVRPQGDKVTRARPLAAQCKAGNVAIADSTDDRLWSQQYLRWLQAFPDGPKDAIDASSGAFAVLNVAAGIGAPARPGAVPAGSQSLKTW
jgi:predicted phage terminase large subunit-like protein